MENVIDNSIRILRERSKYYSKKELFCDDNVAEEMRHMDEMLRMDEKIQEFGERVMRGDKEALAQIEDVMST